MCICVSFLHFQRNGTAITSTYTPTSTTCHTIHTGTSHTQPIPRTGARAIPVNIYKANGRLHGMVNAAKVLVVQVVVAVRASHANVVVAGHLRINALTSQGAQKETERETESERVRVRVRESESESVCENGKKTTHHNDTAKTIQLHAQTCSAHARNIKKHRHLDYLSAFALHVFPHPMIPMGLWPCGLELGLVKLLGHQPT